MSPVLRHALPADVPALELLLASQHLPAYALHECLDTFWVMDNKGTLVGCTGLELYGQAALLRSVTVQIDYRNRQLGERLVRNAIAEAQKRGIRKVFLFTMHAAEYFSRFGFHRCTLEDFEEAVRASFQYQGVSGTPELQARITPMCLELEETAPHA